MTISRRQIVQSVIAGAAVLAAPALGGAAPAVVVLGGGAGGLSAARRLAAAGLAVTLVEQNPRYTACFLSNAVFGALRPLQEFQFDYAGPSRAGLRIIAARVEAIERDRRALRLSGGTRLAYDHLILAPGIAFVEGSVPGWREADAAVMPHGWKAEPDLGHLHAQVSAMPEGGVFAMIAPPAPYRCPPGPYERVSMIAHYLRQHNPRAKILIFDPKENFSKQTLFENAWARHYGGMIERIDPLMGGDLIEVDPSRMQVICDGEAVSVDVCNVIPAQSAPALLQEAGLTASHGWAEVDATSFTSRVDPQIRILGDAAEQGGMPKSAYSAHAQAAVLSEVLLRDLGQAGVRAGPLENICYSLVAPNEGLRVGGRYAPEGGRLVARESFVSAPDEDSAALAATASEAAAWYEALTREMFG